MVVISLRGDDLFISYNLAVVPYNSLLTGIDSFSPAFRNFVGATQHP